MTTAENTESASRVPVKLTLTERQHRNFWAKVTKESHAKGCWEWLGSRHEKGYGWFGLNRKMDKAHRVSYRLFKGEIPAGLCVLHTCDNPPCCNPAHLWLGTDRDNYDDKIAKGRDHKAKPEKNGGGGKLTWDKVREIRALRATGLSQQTIADSNFVSQTLVSLILRNKIWREGWH